MCDTRSTSLLILTLVATVGWSEPPEPPPKPISPRRQLRLPQVPFAYSKLDVPQHAKATLLQLDNTPDDNPITDHGATLGRVLFYDVSLSASRTTSCSSCHQQRFAFTDGVRKSVGHRGELVSRNSMALINLRYYQRGRFFWDERAESLEAQVLMPIENPVEMGHELPRLVTQLASDPIYAPLFEAAFGDSQVSSQRIAKALAQFIRSIVSLRSRYDLGLAQVDSPLQDFPNFTAEENLGKREFFGRAKCADCHLPGHDGGERGYVANQWVIFQLRRPGNNGIDSNLPGDDFGLGAITGKESELGLFKASSLRNLEHSGPYMHDGRFHTIDQVIEHYNWSVNPHENLDPRLQDFFANGLALPEVEKLALTKFLLTLTDEALLADPKYSNPFVGQPEAP